MAKLTAGPDPTSSPLMRFGAELRRLRRARGWSQEKTGQLLGYSDTWISLIERGKEVPTSKLALKADEVFETGGLFVELLRRITSATLLEGFEEFADLESRCRELREFQTGIIPGLLQTREYAAALTGAAVERGTITEAQADERLAFLSVRQRRVLDGRSAPVIHSVMEEACLTRLVGGREVMRQQLEHLSVMAKRPNITLQIAPQSLGELVPFLFPIVLLTMPDRSVIGYTETHARGYVERRSAVCAAWERGYDRLQVEAMSTAASSDVIRSIGKGFE
ncbi:Scr1 family TA system antitoxin-like transcriptional regulator [Kitasatospora sp. RB6PN24]|uniref:Scr1 family TA system antitoxin-like transcriptional regulator n=1 Tax=Kitasatospora humi TaxID=2893891 RepID=UPI001E63924F|nr:Scr1 family TA system antitoxin-like transcriptional regulator [Kitasatospora humi]MCC9311450.1 Scr1 family TA system antitoxin-like transcriptional regulator [Kitasatospora humi]